MAVHQLLVAAAYGDAITNEALTLRQTLRATGDAQIFASRVDYRYEGDVHTTERVDLVSDDDLLLVHASIADDQFREFLARHRGPAVLRYHNVTPSSWFWGFDPGFGRQLDAARVEIAEMRDRFTATVSDSRYNADDLIAMGYPAGIVSPLVVDGDRFRRMRPEVSRSVTLPDRSEGPLIVFVGRLAPNKQHPLLVETFSVIKRYLEPRSRLVMVGGGETPGYRACLDELIRRLGVTDVTFAGHVEDAELAAIYARADVFLTLSGHEGFCAPVVEAMALGVPVVAWGACAVAETVARGGLVLDSCDPVIAAEAVWKVLTDPAFAAQLRERGYERAAEFAPETTAPAMVRLLAGMVAPTPTATRTAVP